ncbi:MAG: molybdopterin oxidoreductase family protein, partial [Pseudomonadota bacterium]
SMNTRGVMNMLTDTDDKGDYVIPRIIYSDAYSSEMVAYADLVLPDTTYLERHDCISLLDRPICEADAAADAIRWPVVEPDRQVRGFQTALVQLANKMKLPGFTNEDGSAKYEDYADYIVNHQRKPGIGPLAGWRKKGNEEVSGRGDPNPEQIDRYIKNGGFFVNHIPDDCAFMKPWNAGYQDWAVGMGIYDSPQPYVFDLYVETMRKFQLAAEGHGDRQPPDHLRDRIKATLDPLPIWYPPFEDDHVDPEEYPVHALTQRPMAMYHSWGTQNAWLRQIHGRNPLYVPTEIWEENEFQEGDWVEVTSAHGSITVPVAHMAALNANTVWTWNAIGKRKGAWALSEDAPEATRGFLLNHLIHELLPPKGDGLRWSNSDPITGQAAWFDLRVKIRKAAAPDEAQPGFDPIRSPVGQGPTDLTWKVGR